MVGVAGRSKACVTCKQRKIRCSLERPECRVCIKSSRQCGGYHRDRVFVLDARTAKDIQQNTIAIFPDQKPTPRISIEARKQHVVESPNIFLTEEPISPFNFWQVTGPVKQTDSMKRSISTHNAFSSLWNISSPSTRSCYRQQILNEYLHSYYGGVADPVKTDKISGGWLTMLPDLPHITTALEAAILAVCTARLGRVNGDQALVRESLKFYTQGLWELQKALWSPILMYRDETMAACMILLMYEVFECPDKNVTGWLGHIRGCAKLVELKGPKAYGSEFAHRLFMTFRQLEIQQAIVERRSTFLANPAWIEMPWRGYTKPLNHALLDLMAEMASIGEAGCYPTNPENPFLLAAELFAVMHRCWALDAKLQAFYSRFEKEADGPLYWPAQTVPGNALDGTQTFPVTFEFSNLGTAHTCLLYWATCSILWSGLIKIYEVLGHLEFLMKALAAGGPTLPLSTPIHDDNLIPVPTVFDPTVISEEMEKGCPIPPPKDEPVSSQFPPATALPPLGHRVDIPAMANIICQSLPYYMSQLTRAGAPITASVFPLKVAIEGFCGVPGYEKELAWALGTFQMLTDNGAQLLGHLGLKVTDKNYLSA